MKNKKAQITIFIIIAVLMVVAILLIFFAVRQRNVSVQEMLDPNSNIQKCTKDAVEKAVDIMLPQGGYISPTNYKLFNNNKAAYLCYNKNYYFPCINQEPIYISHLEKEITNYIKPKIDECFYSLQLELEKRNYNIETGGLEVTAEVVPNNIKIHINKKFDLTRNEETRSYKKFEVKLISPLFDLANIAREIVNQESKYCNFEYLGFMLFYPRFDIDKNAVGSAETASKIYIIGDRNSGKRLYIAIRSCAIPPGF